MNKSDLKLIVIVIIIIFMCFISFKFLDKKESKKAIVYYENKEILTIDLNDKEKKIYEVDGFNGKVKIVTLDGKVKVEQEKSPLNLCSKQGYIRASYESIVCLPNKITIKIEAKAYVDTIVK